VLEVDVTGAKMMSLSNGVYSLTHILEVFFASTSCCSGSAPPPPPTRFLLLTMFGQWSIWQPFILIVVHPGQG